MIKKDEIIVKSLPSSFVFRSLKLSRDTGSGEAKLHMGSVKNKKEFDEFFDNYNIKNQYYFEKDNLLLYLQQTKIEYLYQKINNYTDINLNYWNEQYGNISGLTDEKFKFTLTKFEDKSRYYIRSNDDIFKNILRKISLPLITNINIIKYEDNNVFVYKFNLEINQNYKDKDIDKDIEKNINEKTGENRIYYGAPGTGKSHTVDKIAEDEFDSTYRVIFYPEYTHDDFVGSFMPAMGYEYNNSQKYVNADGSPLDIKGKPVPYYTFIPGPFTNALVDALNNPDKSILLIIEELNRANAAAVFGEIFQLLDRKYEGKDTDGESKYEINISNEFSEYLSSKVAGYNIGDKIRIPCNLSLYATMNSADQGVTPLDSAFKRRWNFEYIPIDFNEAKHKDYEIVYAGNKLTWQVFGETINKKLISLNINEDKLLGEYFINEFEIKDADKFVSKVISYLFDDVLKFNRRGFFKPDYKTFSQLKNAFADKEIFDFEFKYSKDSHENAQENYYDVEENIADSNMIVAEEKV